MKKYTWYKIVHWSLFAAVILYMISGLGITYPRVVEPLTFGIINKRAAFAVHIGLFWPFVLLLMMHLYFTLGYRLKNKNKK